MKTQFHSPLSADLRAFLQFKRNLGFRYVRAEFTLLEFDRFLQLYADRCRAWRLDQAILTWLATKPRRKAVSVSMDVAVLRQLYLYLRRLPGRHQLREPLWPRLPTESRFVPYILSKEDVQSLLELAAQLDRPPFRATLYRALLLLLYCTGLRFGEALRLRMRDVDIEAGVLFVEQSKGRARWVPFHRSLSRELADYLTARRAFASEQPEDRVFIGANRKTLPARTASCTVRKLFQKAGLKPARGRAGPRPYDFRHAFAVHRLTRWYRQGVDLHAHLPWLSAYMGHDDILGTETYLSATPELLSLAGNRFRRRYLSTKKDRSAER
jgi:site-specific recombinase XerD